MSNAKVKKLVTCKALLWVGSANKEHKNPVKIRVTHDRIQKYYPIQIAGKKLFLTPAEWEATQQDNPRKESKILKSEIGKIVAAADTAGERITANGRPFTWERFEKEFLQQESKGGILSLFEKYLGGLLEDERIGSYDSYKNSYNAFNRFRGGKSETRNTPFVRGKEIKPEDLTVEVLKKFDAWLKRQGCNKTTIGIYMRALRIIYNLAVDTNPSLAEFYPFARKANDNKRYKIRTGAGKKGEALSVEDLQKFMDTAPIEGTPEWEAKNYWLFMFYAQGMNMADVAALKWPDVRWDAIRYTRKKTQDTETQETVIEVPMSEPIKKIILAIGNEDKSPAAHVFPILAPGMDAQRSKATTKQKTKWVNKWIGRLCEANGLPEVTTYWTRHTYASLLKESGTPVEMISELLGHGDVKTTRAYLQRFELQKKQAANDKVHALLKVS